MSTESVMLFNHLVLCHPLLLLPLIFLSIRFYFQWVSSSHQVAKVLEHQLQHRSFQWIFRVDFLLDLLVWSPFSPKAPQDSLVLSLLYDPFHTSVHDYWKAIALTIWTFVGKVISLIFNTLSRFVIAFLQRSKHLISWLQSSFKMTVESTKIQV